MNKNVTLKICLINGSIWKKQIEKEYAKDLIKMFNSKKNKNETLMISNFNKEKNVRIINTEHINLMCIQEDEK